MLFNTFKAVVVLALLANTFGVCADADTSQELVKRQIGSNVSCGIPELKPCTAASADRYGCIPAGSTCCGSSLWCSSGVCSADNKTCTNCTTKCNGICANFNTDYENCGGCGLWCGGQGLRAFGNVDSGRGFCENGQCRVGCFSGYTLVGGVFCANESTTFDLCSWDTPLTYYGPLPNGHFLWKSDKFCSGCNKDPELDIIMWDANYHLCDSAKVPSNKARLIGGIVGGVGGLLLLLALAALAVWYYRRRRATGNVAMAGSKPQRDIRFSLGPTPAATNKVPNNPPMLPEPSRLADGKTTVLADPAPHWFFSQIAASLKRTGEPTVPFIGKPFVVVREFMSNSQDEITLLPGEFVDLKDIFSDGWGMGYNIDNREYGAFPVDCLLLDTSGGPRAVPFSPYRSTLGYPNRASSSSQAGANRVQLGRARYPVMPKSPVDPQATPMEEYHRASTSAMGTSAGAASPELFLQQGRAGTSQHPGSPTLRSMSPGAASAAREEIQQVLLPRAMQTAPGSPQIDDRRPSRGTSLPGNRGGMAME